MRIVLSALIALLPGPALAASFDVSLDEIDGRRVLVVARAGGGAAAVAAGGEDLTVLRGEAAEQAIAGLSKVDAPAAPEAPAAPGEKRKKKIVIHKMEIDEDDHAGGAEDVEVRVIRKADGERREETILKDGDDFLIEGDEAGRSVERRIIRLKGVDEARALKFIDETDGLDAGEKAEMKAAAGI